jgi:hypothetical protein
MDIQALLQALVPQRYTLSGGLDSLKPGDRLSGRILEHRPDGQTLVDFGRFRALAELKVPLPQNATVNLQVMETGDKVRMSIVTPGQGTQTTLEVPLSRFEVLTGDLFQQLRGDIKQLLTLAPRSAAAQGSAQPGQAAAATPGEGSGALPTALRSILSQVQTQLTPIDPQARMEQLLPQIRSAVIDSGIYFEKRLEGVLRALQARLPGASLEQLSRQPEIRQLFNEDLKPNLLVLKDNFYALPKGRNPEMEMALNRVRTTVDHLLADIDHQQRQMISRAFGPEPEQVFSHWLHLQDNPHLSRLKIFHRKHKDASGDAAPRVSLLLDMDRLGEVRTDLYLASAQLNLHFFVTSEAVKANLEAHLDELTAKLEDGAQGVSVQVTVSRDKVDRLKREPALPAASQSLVDLKA